jgi:hypothetical protein
VVLCCPPSYFLCIDSLVRPQIKTEVEALKQTTAGVNPAIQSVEEKQKEAKEHRKV